MNFFARGYGSGPGRGPGWRLQPVHLQAGGGVGASTSKFFYGFRDLGVPLNRIWTLKSVKKRLYTDLRVPLDMLLALAAIFVWIQKRRKLSLEQEGMGYTRTTLCSN